ncbi:hypothetical protein ACQ4PT_011301 [Festuca glaucescens]
MMAGARPPFSLWSLVKTGYAVLSANFLARSTGLVVACGGPGHAPHLRVTASRHDDDFFGGVISRLIALLGDLVRLRGTTLVVEVLEGHCWVEGDNTRESKDSRHYGPKDDEAAATADGDASDDEILINLIRKKARTTPQKPSAATQEKAKEKTHVKAKKKTPVKAKKKTPVKAKKKIPVKNTAAKEKAKKKTPVKKTTFTGNKTSKNVPFAPVIPPPPSPPAVQPATGAKRSLLYWLGG